MPRHAALRSLVFTLAVTAATTAPAFAQQKYRFRAALSAGDLSAVDSTMDLSLSTQVSANGAQAAELTFVKREHEKFSEEILAADPAGPSRIRRVYTLSRGLETDPDGKEKRIVSSLQGRTVTVQRRGGQVVVSCAQGRLAPADRKSVMKALDQFDSRFFPDRDLAPGDEWTVDPQQWSDSFEGMSKVQVQCKFQDVVPYEGHPCAQIHITMDMSGQPAGTPAPMTMRLAGELYFATDLQRTLSIALSGPVNMSAQSRENGVALTIAGEGTMRLNESRRWLKTGSKPVASRG